jgi:enediyne biosynthesis protein E4
MRRRDFFKAGAVVSIALANKRNLLAEIRSDGHPSGDLATGTLGQPGVSAPRDYPRIQFRDVSKEAGINFEHFPGTRSTQLPEDMGSGAAWGDYDNDGYPDLYAVNIAGPLTLSPEQLANSPGASRLYHNNGDGTFSDVTERAGVAHKGIGMAAAWADYDNDGHLDLVVTSYGQINLYHNNGDGKFTDVTRTTGLDKYRGFWAGASWGDYDRDGFAELYICGYVQYAFRPEDWKKTSAQYSTLVPYTLDPEAYLPERNLLFHYNKSNGTFTEVGKRAGVDDSADRSLSAGWYDFDGDGWPDLYVANDLWGSKLYLNQHDGTFKDMTREVGLSDFRGQMGVAIGDWDNNGTPDIFVTHWIYQEDALFTNFQASPGGPGKPGILYFGDEGSTTGLGRITHNDIGWGTSFFDVDNDGKLDIFVVNGSTFQDGKNPRLLVPMKNLLFWQKSPQEGFLEVGSVSGSPFQETHVGRGAAFADYDNDGNMDVFIVNHQGRGMLLRNDGGNKNSWIKVRVKCTKSNRTGFGTKVEIEAEGQKQVQEIGGQPSYLSQNFQEAHFGLNQAKQVARLKVTFLSGIVREQENIDANQIIQVRE